MGIPLCSGLTCEFRSFDANNGGEVTGNWEKLLHGYMVTLLHCYIVKWLHGYMVKRITV